MALCPEHHIDFLLHYTGEYEREVAAIFPRIITPGQIVIDLGANIGYYSVGAALLTGPSGSVHAFEPVPATFRQLEESVQINHLPNVVINNLAVSDHPGTATIYVGGICPGSSSFAPNELSASECEVNVTTLDDYVREQSLPSVDFIKMDIEGAEMLALLGMRDVLSRFQPSILFEFNPPCLRRLGVQPEQVLKFLEDYGYSFYSADKRLMPLRSDGITQYGNIYASTHGIDRSLGGS